MKIYITGHKSPDLDSIASAHTYAEFLKKIKRYEGAELIPARSDDANKETEYAFHKFNVEVPVPMDNVELKVGDAVILVDHNEESQRHEKINHEHILEIVDHHKINLSFTTPIRLDAKPYGATNTLIYELFKMYGLKPSESSLGLMLASILSDTIGLKSPTTSGYDSEYATEIANKLDIDMDKLTYELFKAKSDITNLTTSELATKDFKVFDFGGKKVFINVIETVEPDILIDQKEKLLQALEEIKAEKNVGQAYCVITDIIKLNSHVLYTTSEEESVIEEAFTTKGKNGIANIGPKISRKKDIAPAIEKVLGE